MTKTISLADDAYELLASVKRPGESFSDVARRLASMAALDAVFDPDFRLAIPEADADAWISATYEARDRAKTPRVTLE